MGHVYRYTYLLMAIVLTTVCACDSSTGTVNNSETGYIISGRVVDSDDNGVDGVSVKISGGNYSKTVVTLEDGIYTFSNVPDGLYDIIYTKDETRFASASHEVFVDSGNISIDNVYIMQTIPGIGGLIVAPIPGGTFQMGNSEDDQEWPAYTVTVSSFEMSIYEITNAQYAAYLNEALTSGEIEVISGDVYGKTGFWSGQQYLDIGYSYDSSNQCWVTYNSGVFSVPSGYENWPVVAVTWYGAKSFAEHYGLDLPRESEWEYACRWGSHQYRYGTDDGTINPNKVNYTNSNIGHPVAVGSYPANPFGLYDMTGNVSEWCANDPDENVTEPTGPPTEFHRTCRGGNWESGKWYNSAYYCLAYIRVSSSPSSLYRWLGFRVVRRP